MFAIWKHKTGAQCKCYFMTLLNRCFIKILKGWILEMSKKQVSELDQHPAKDKGILIGYTWTFVWKILSNANGSSSYYLHLKSWLPDWENWAWTSGVWYNSIIILNHLNPLTDAKRAVFPIFQPLYSLTSSLRQKGLNLVIRCYPYQSDLSQHAKNF